MAAATVMWATGAFGLGLGGRPAGAVPAGTGGDSIQAGDAAEAWYQTTESTLCSSPVGCPPVSLPTGSYPKDTLHVGVSGGIETAATYLLPDLSAYLGGALPAAGTMTLPVATIAGNGTSNPAAATIRACLSKAPFKDGTQGSTSPPPATDCSVHGRLVRDSSGSDFTLDLSPFLEAWSTGTPDYGIALIPDPNSTGPTTSWHVAFDGRNLAGAAHISSTFTPAPTASSTPAPPAGLPPSSSPVPAAPTAVPSPSAGPAPLVTPSSPAVPSNAAASLPALAGVGSPAPAAGSGTGTSSPAAGQFASTTTRGFQYPEILLLPLVLAAGALAVIRLLTSDATPRRLRAR